VAELRGSVTAAEGRHARPAALFVKAAAEAATATGVAVSIAKPDGAPVDARSILSVLSLDVRHGDEVVLSADGAEADDVLRQLALVLADG
jgi:phosphocarrier protein HPr